jgi:hypothetical protein
MMSAPVTLFLTLDHAGLIPVSVMMNTTRCDVRIDVQHITHPALRTYLYEHVTLRAGDHKADCIWGEGALRVSLSRWSEDDAYRLYINEQAVLGWGGDPLPSFYRLTVMELRMLGQYPHPYLPYARHHTPIVDGTYRIRTDLHTHLSSQITAEQLLCAAIAVNASYPVELLTWIGIDVTDLPTHDMRSYPFMPAASEGLQCEQVGQMVQGVLVRDMMPYPAIMTRLTQALSIAPDAVVTFDELERRIYRLRNPLVKHPAILAEMIQRVAEGYQQQGIVYAELAVTAALDPDWLAAALPAIAQAEQNTGVTLRLLAAIPRSLAPMTTLMQLSIVRFIAQHPYIVGIDFLGYEANKTRNFAWALSNIARYAATQRHGIDAANIGWHFADDFILRVHAGENGKNPDNVGEVLAIAARYGVRVRVGHAAYSDESGCLQQARALADKGLVIIEFNPDSNMAMNNIDRAEQLPITTWTRAGIPAVLASDGGGIYHTDAEQLLMAGVFSGMEEADIALLERSETAHIAHQQALYLRKSEAYQARFSGDDAFIADLRCYIHDLRSSDTMARLSGKIPLLIAGASGSSWARIDVVTRQEIARGIHALVRLLDPTQVCFVMGRVKQEGIGQVLDMALDAYLADTPHAIPFDVVGMLSGQQNMPTLAAHINHIVPLTGELMSVPTQMTELLKKHGGCALYIGGSAFTRDFIMCSTRLRLPFGVMAGVAGASGEKAEVLDSPFVFHGAEGMVRHVIRMVGADACNAFTQE